MRPVDHFLSQLDKLERSAPALSALDEDRLVRDFNSLCAPVIGESAAEDLCRSILDRLSGANPPPLRKIGFTAAFLLGEFDDTMRPCGSLSDKKDSVGATAPGVMSLGTDDWEDIRETLEDASGEMNLETLTSLMGELLSRGKLG